MRSAYLLVSHGSSDPRHQAGLSRLAKGLRQHLTRSLREAHQPTVATLSGRLSNQLLTSNGVAQGNFADVPLKAFAQSRVLPPAPPLVGTATLELSEISLAQQIEAFAQKAQAQGLRQVVVIPLFLLAGVHVKEDLPQEIAAARAHVSSRIRIICTPHLGSQNSFQQYVAHRLARTEAERCVLLAHGSRRSAGNRAIQQLGKRLNADTAFWSVPPDLETQVYNLMQQGYRHLAIAPYFLFPGGITDAITRRTEELAERFPTLSLRLLSPVGTSTDLSKVVAELALSVPHTLSSSTWSESTSAVAEEGITA